MTQEKYNQLIDTLILYEKQYYDESSIIKVNHKIIAKLKNLINN